MSRQKIHQNILFIGTVLLVIGLPVSHFLLSTSIIILSINWAVEIILCIISKNDTYGCEKLLSLKNRKAIWLILSIYFLHLIWFFNTTNFSYAMHDIRIKLPLLALPIIYGTSPRFEKRQFKLVLQSFLITVLISSFISTYIILGFSKIDLVDSRYASLFISHIRFSLLVVLLIYTLIYLAFFHEIRVSPWEKLIYILCIIWLISFLILLQSFTGIVIFLFLLPVAIIWWSYTEKKENLKLIAYLSTSVLLLFMLFYAWYSYNRFERKKSEHLTELAIHTPNGSPYSHHPEIKDFENGYLIWINISEKEMRSEWNKISTFPYDSLDRKGQSLHLTLIRYLTSMGCTKDSLGISQLTAEDLDMIEKGYSNYLFKNKFALYPRIYVLLWEIERYKKTGNPSGQSLGQRIEYLKTGLHILKRHFWLGTGTGDTNEEFRIQYIIDNSKLNSIWRHRTHNQFITLFLTFGVFGFTWFLIALFAPPRIEKQYNKFLFTIFFLISILSMLNEDTLETHVGVSFFAFFYSFLLFSMPENSSSSNDKA
jgi:hypothetical protein